MYCHSSTSILHLLTVFTPFSNWLWRQLSRLFNSHKRLLLRSESLFSLIIYIPPAYVSPWASQSMCWRHYNCIESGHIHFICNLTKWSTNVLFTRETKQESILKNPIFNCNYSIIATNFVGGDVPKMSLFAHNHANWLLIGLNSNQCIATAW